MQLAPLYPVLHQVLKPVFPTCLWAGANTPTIALTFDDGPHPSYTPQLLKVLDRHGVKASFFWLGMNVQATPHVARQVFERGHWVGLHGYRHDSFPQLSHRDLQQSLIQSQRAIAQACELEWDYVRQQVRDVRPPNGLFTPQTLQHLRRWNYRPVMWSVVPEDWVLPGVKVAAERVLQQTVNGSLIVLHDGYCGGQDVAAIADYIIPRLKDQGYSFVTVDEFWLARSGASPVISK
jgi:peptidoglycan/xylan/chitin deacetylase (PgdA/CDA1 family)